MYQNINLKLETSMIKTSISIQQDMVNKIKVEREKHSDLNKWLFEAQLTSLEFTLNLLKRELRNLEVLGIPEPTNNKAIFTADVIKSVSK